MVIIAGVRAGRMRRVERGRLSDIRRDERLMVGREGVSYPNPNTRLKSGREKNNASQPTALHKPHASSGLACLVSILVGDLGPFLSSSP